MLGTIWRAFVFAAVAAAVVAGLLYSSYVVAQARAVTVLATTIEVPVLTWAVKAVTDEPRLVDTVVAGAPTVVARPGGGSRWTAIVFVNGATPKGRHHPDVQRLAHGLARAGHLILVPDLPGLRRGRITDATVDATVRVALAADGQADVARLGFVGVSVGTTLALLASEDPRLAGRVDFVAGFAPYVDLEQVILLATTGAYHDSGRLRPYDADDFLDLAVGRSLAAGLREPDRSRLLAQLAPLDDDSDDPLRALERIRASELGPEGRAVLRLLRNRAASRFDRLYAALSPRIRAGIRRLSPLDRAERLRMPIELASAPHDKYFPIAESRALARRAPDVRVTVTETLDHAIPAPSLGDIADLFRFDAFVVRVLRIARP